ncbi:MAG: PspA/IM30 family protein [Acidimicrobiales bacterium]
MKRLSGIIQAKANKALDKAEDPRDTLDLSYEKQLENLQKVRRGLADVATAKKRIELQANQLQTQANKLQDQAKQALTQGREDLAREALTRRSAIAQQLTDLQTQHEQIDQQQQTLLSTSQRLQATIESFRTKKETLKASYTAAQAQVNIDEAASGISESMGDAGLAMQRAQDKISSMQARAGAMDELVTEGAFSDPTQSDDIQAQLDKASGSADVEAALAQLQSEVAPRPAGQIGASSTSSPESIAAPGKGTSGSSSAPGDAVTAQPSQPAESES